jgi:hypothetical protein
VHRRLVEVEAEGVEALRPFACQASEVVGGRPASEGEVVVQMNSSAVGQVGGEEQKRSMLVPLVAKSQVS